MYSCKLKVKNWIKVRFAMLETLDQIDWKSRNAEEVPEWIRGLTSKIKEVRIDSFARLEDNVIQGRVSFETFDFRYGIPSILSNDAPYLIIPFLIELLENEETEEKWVMLYMLNLMTYYVHFKDVGDYIDLAKQIRTRIWEGHKTYFKLLGDAEIKARRYAVVLLTKFVEHASEIIPELETMLARETDSEVYTLVEEKLQTLKSTIR
jgi:hypothetical protein